MPETSYRMLEVHAFILAIRRGLICDNFSSERSKMKVSRVSIFLDYRKNLLSQILSSRSPYSYLKVSKE